MTTNTNLTSLEVSKLTAVMTGGGYKRAASKEAAVARYLKTAEEVGMADAATLLGDEYGFDTAHHVLVERKKGGHASIPEALADASLTEAEGFTDEQDAELARLQNEEADEANQTIDTNVGDHGSEPLSDEELDLQPGEETSEGEIGRWKQTDDGPVWQARRPVASPTETLVGRVSVEDAMNGELFGGRSKKIAEVKGEPEAAPTKGPKAESKTAMLLRLAQTPEGITNAKMKELTGWTKLGGFFNAAKKAGLDLTRVRENGDTTWRAALAKAE